MLNTMKKKFINTYITENMDDPYVVDNLIAYVEDELEGTEDDEKLDVLGKSIIDLEERLDKFKQFQKIIESVDVELRNMVMNIMDNKELSSYNKGNLYVNVANNNPSVKYLDSDGNYTRKPNLEVIPAEYVIKKEKFEIDKDAVKKAVDARPNINIPGLKVVKGRHVKVYNRNQ